ncbi:hypothetical protein AB4300_22505 [Vibrio lentus]
MNTFDKSLRLLTIITAVVTIFLSVQTLLENGLSTWVFISTGVFIAVLIVSLVKTYKKGNVEFFGLIGSMLGGLTLGRLFSTMHLENIDISTLSSLDPLMIAETGPGIHSIEITSTLLFILLTIQIVKLPWLKKTSAQDQTVGSPNAYEWGMTLVRIS